MTYAGRRTVLGLAAAAAVGGRLPLAPAGAATGTGNPLFTAAQRRLDARGLRLWQGAEQSRAQHSAE